MTNKYHTTYEDEEIGVEYDILVEYIYSGGYEGNYFEPPEEESIEIVGFSEWCPAKGDYVGINEGDYYTELEVDDLAIECLEDYKSY